LLQTFKKFVYYVRFPALTVENPFSRMQI